MVQACAYLIALKAKRGKALGVFSETSKFRVSDPSLAARARRCGTTFVAFRIIDSVVE